MSDFFLRFPKFATNCILVVIFAGVITHLHLEVWIGWNNVDEMKFIMYSLNRTTENRFIIIRTW